MSHPAVDLLRALLGRVRHEHVEDRVLDDDVLVADVLIDLAQRLDVLLVSRLVVRGLAVEEPPPVRLLRLGERVAELRLAEDRVAGEPDRLDLDLVAFVDEEDDAALKVGDVLDRGVDRRGAESLGLVRLEKNRLGFRDVAQRDGRADADLGLAFLELVLELRGRELLVAPELEVRDGGPFHDDRDEHDARGRRFLFERHVLEQPGVPELAEVPLDQVVVVGVARFDAEVEADGLGRRGLPAAHEDLHDLRPVGGGGRGLGGERHRRLRHRARERRIGPRRAEHACRRQPRERAWGWASESAPAHGPSRDRERPRGPPRELRPE